MLRVALEEDGAIILSVRDHPEVAVLETEQARVLDRERASREVGERLHSLEASLKDVSSRLDTISDEERARLVRQFVARIIVTSRFDEHGQACPHAHVTYTFVLPEQPNNYDIACARHFGARAVGVVTGRANDVETLRPHEPDALLHDLSDTQAVIRALNEL